MAVALAGPPAGATTASRAPPAPRRGALVSPVPAPPPPRAVAAPAGSASLRQARRPNSGPTAGGRVGIVAPVRAGAADESGTGPPASASPEPPPPPPPPRRPPPTAALSALARRLLAGLRSLAAQAVTAFPVLRRLAFFALVALTASVGAAAGRAGAARLLGAPLPGAAAPPAALPASSASSSPEVPYSRFLALVRAGSVRAAAIDGASGRVTFEVRERRRKGGGAGSAAAPPRATILTTTRIAGDPGLIQALVAGGVEFAASTPPPGAAAARLAGQCLALWVPLLPLLWFASRAVGAARGGGGGGAGVPGVRRDGGRGGSRSGAGGGASPPRVTFADVAGVDGAKAELAEAVAALRDPAAFADVGAVAPSGVLLYGPPGTGKTLLARAVAGEAGVPFLACSASEFVELYVGRGAARVRALFAAARKAAPCVVFIDELDAVGGRRGGGGSNDERDQTLNQLLTELDGFDGAGRAGVLLLAATNRAGSLDPALVRPGRLSRRVAVPLPDLPGRAAILGVHLRRVALAGGPGARGVEADRLAARSAGLSGAQLADAVNDAALLAVRAGRRAVAPGDLDAAMERAIHGVDGRGGGAAGGALTRAVRGAAASFLGGAAVQAGGGAPPPAAAG